MYHEVHRVCKWLVGARQRRYVASQFNADCRACSSSFNYERRCLKNSIDYVYNAIQYPNDDDVVHYLCALSGLVAEDVAIKQIRLHRGYRFSYFIGGDRGTKVPCEKCRTRKRIPGGRTTLPKLWRISSWISNSGRKDPALCPLPPLIGCTSARCVNIIGLLVETKRYISA